MVRIMVREDSVSLQLHSENDSLHKLLATHV